MDEDLRMINRCLKSLEQNDLPSALDNIMPYVDTHPYVMFTEDVKQVYDNFRMMLHYYEKGAEDPQNRQMYVDMLNKMKRAVRNIRADYRRRHVDFYKDAWSHIGNGMPMSEKAIKVMLENFVSDEAMLQFEPEETRGKNSSELYSKHYAFMQSLFCYIVASDLWSREQADKVTEIILSPTVDSSDAQMIVSALMIAVMNSFDINKFRILVDVYKSASDETLRQKALVGWVLGMTDSVAYDEQRDCIKPLCDNPKVRRELVDLQKQIVFCMNADKDNEIIQREIIPTLMRNSDLSVTRFGITEKNEDVMQNVLDPGAQDRAMEENEEKFRQMIDMQKNGADIYFGGFSKMKRFPFFYSLSNWFCPFSLNHPAIAKVYDGRDNYKFLSNLRLAPLFCDSDKYSFALALASVIDRLPQAVREMMGGNEMFARMDASLGQTAGDIRRRILQDVYRFSRLYRWSQQIYNPFTVEHCLFVSNRLLAETPLRENYLEIGKFLRKQSKKLFDGFVQTLLKDTSKDSFMLIGLHYMDIGDYKAAKEYFAKVVEMAPQDDKALMCYAKTCFRNEDFEEAYGYYSLHYQQKSGDRNFALEYSIILINLKRYEDASKVLFKLDFEYPDNITVKRVLAWNLMCQKKLEQADKEYLLVLENSKNIPADYLNAGYCCWFMGNIEKSTALFKRFYGAASDSSAVPSYNDVAERLGSAFDRDERILSAFGITEFDRMMIYSITFSKLKDI